MDLFSELNDRLLFAVPKKGRLHEVCLGFLQGADIQFHRKPRHDIALVKNHPIALVFLPAADIAKYVGGGRVDLGITGQDIIAESGFDAEADPPSPIDGQPRIRELMPLDFGKCRLMIQTPIKSGINNVEDLIGKRIVTSFEGLSKRFFRRLEAEVHGSTATAGSGPPTCNTTNDASTSAPLQTSVEFVSGSVEAACALGLADGIVDLVESGETMRAAGLQAIATVIESQAVLIANPRTRFPELVTKIQSRIEGHIASRKYMYISYNVERALLDQAKTITPGRQAPTINALIDDAWVAVSVMVPTNDVAEVMDQLKLIGATDILVFGISNCRV
ncbi:ATP phosphoribosyltransferase (ATP-PRTase) (ATP-PRT) [Dimargaris cristalligena]|uniref:ATP phosphoribosyltransferase n=1 Tax=Dimargaris cristalligena TaxID=215637 RepID=A0A4P9ZXK9_9FUNG|nr:ATP phosphoribosyltransferase (ATP-PRTase) (ATP-PRT) [Dimargaris cristalligena]RKP38377.1 hypothetical protein BJ085DRAFT_24715 [Dimargaris cristalligena]|eukprot:RKP38377.1 hypothetical protein BJ085DRAFT_24715 [Dimargaris cristalligena]